LKIQSIFQKYVDNAVSKTVNLRNEAAVDEVRKIYLMAYELGLKGVTIYRDRSKEVQVLTKGREEKEEKIEKFMTDELLSVIDGIKEFDRNCEIVVCDSHSNGRNIDIAKFT